MLAPKFLTEKFTPGTPVSVWFCSDTNKGAAMRGSVRGWEEHGEELTTYLVFELATGNALYLPFSDIYLSELSAEELNEAKEAVVLEKRIKAIRQKALNEELEQAERGEGRIARPPMPGMGGMPGGGRLM